MTSINFDFGDEEQTGIDFDFDDATPTPTEPPKPVEVAPEPTPAPTPQPKASIEEDPMSSIRQTLKDRQKEEEDKKKLPGLEIRNPKKEEKISKPTYDFAKVGGTPSQLTKKDKESTKRVAGEAVTQSAEFAPQLTTGKAAYDLLVKAPVDALDSVLPNAAGEKSIPKKLVDKFYESTGLDRADKESAGIRKELKDFGVPQAKTKDEQIAGTVLSMAGGIAGPSAAVKTANLAEDIARSEKTAQFLKDESGTLNIPGGKDNKKKIDISPGKEVFAEAKLKDGTPVDLVAFSPEDGIVQITATTKDNKKIGTVEFYDESGDGSTWNADVFVEDAWQRKGVASSMYDLFYKDLGHKVWSNAGAVRTEQGVAFRKKWDSDSPSSVFNIRDDNTPLSLPEELTSNTKSNFEPIKDANTSINEFIDNGIYRSISPQDTSTSISSKADILDQKIKEGIATPRDYTNVSSPNLSPEDLVEGYKVFENDPVMMAYYAKNSATQVGDSTIDTYVREVKPKDLTFRQKVNDFIDNNLKGTRNLKRAQTSTTMTLNKFALQRDLQRNTIFKDKDIYGPDFYVGRRDLLEQSPQARIEVYHDTGTNARRSIIYGKDDFVLVPEETADGGILNRADTRYKSLHKSLDDVGVIEGIQEFSDLMEYMVALDNIDQYNLNNKRIIDLKLKLAENPEDTGLKKQLKDLQEYNYDMPIEDAFKLATDGDKRPGFVQYKNENRDRNFLVLDLFQKLSGKLSPESVKNIKEARPNYIPNGREWTPEDATLSDDAFDNLFTFRTVNPEDVVEARKGKNLTKRINPFVAQEEYLYRAMNSIIKSNVNRASLNFFLQLPDDQWKLFFRENKADVLNTLNSFGRLSPESASILRNKILSITDIDNFPVDRVELLERVKDFGLSQRDQLLIENNISGLEDIISKYRGKAVSNRSPMTSEQARAAISKDLDTFIEKLSSTSTRKVSRVEITPVEPGKALSKDVVTFDVGGNKMQLTVNDGELFRYFQGTAPMSGNRGRLNQLLSTFSAGARNILILNPEFSLMVGARETQDALAYQNAAKGLADRLLRTATYPLSIANRATYLAPELRATHLKILDNLWGGNRYNEYLDRINTFKANYGAHATFEGYRPEKNLSAEKKTQLIESGKYFDTKRGLGSIVYDGLSNVASRFDMSGRMWLYDNLIKDGMSEVEAQHMANNMGVNFVQEGIPLTKKAEGKTLRDATSTVYFLTAGLNGIYRTVGMYRYEPKMVAASIATVATYYGAIETWNQSQINPKTGKPFIDELSDDVKANKIIIMKPNAKSANDYYRFGLGFALGPAAKNSVEAIKDIHSAATMHLSDNIKKFMNDELPEAWKMEEFDSPEERAAFKRELRATGRTPEDLARLAINTFTQTISVPLTMGQYQPFIDLTIGSQARSGLPLEGKGRYDYSPSTSLTIKEGVDKVNELFDSNISPRLTDTTVKGLTGLAGKSFFDLADYLFTARLNGQELPEVTRNNIPIARVFTGNEGGSTRTQIDQIYQNMTNSFFNPLKDDLAATKKIGDEKRLNSLSQQYGREIELLKNKEKIDERISALYDQKRRLMFPQFTGEQGEFGITPDKELMGDPNLRARLNQIDEEITDYRRAFVENVLTSGSKSDIIKYGQYYNRAFTTIPMNPQYEYPNSNNSTGTNTVPVAPVQEQSPAINFDFR